MRNIALLALVLASCGGSSREPDGSVTALFGPTDVDAPPSYGTTPFPSESYFTADGHFEAIPGLDLLVPALTDELRAHLRTLDGVATRPALEVFVDGLVDESSVPALSASTSDAIFVVDEAGDPVPFNFRFDGELLRIAGSPVTGTLLTPGASYLLVATRALRGLDGPLARDPDFDALLRTPANSLPARFRSTRRAIDEALALGVARSDLVAVAPFHVAREEDVLLAARERMESAPLPTLTFPDASILFDATELDAVLGTTTRDAGGAELPGWDNPTGLAHDHVAALGTGVITTTRFRRLDLPSPNQNDVSSGTFDVGPDGIPAIVDPAYPIPITIALPNTPMPTAGFPVLLYGHGLSASRQQMLMMMETAAAEGYAVIGIDASSHGSRFRDVDVTNNLATMLPAFSGTAGMKDGFGDMEGFAAALQLFHNFTNVSAMRDEMRQTALDWGSVVRLVVSGTADLGPLGVPNARFDGAHIVYFGESFGGVIGGLVAAIEPNLNGIVLNVPGGAFVDLAGGYSPTLAPLVRLGVAGTYQSYGTFDRFHAVISFANAILDGADPIVFAHLVQHRATLGAITGRPRDILLLESIGDEIMANVGTEAMAYAMQVDQLGPTFASVRDLVTVGGTVQGNVGGRTGLLLQFAPASHGENWSRTAAKRTVEPFFGEATSWTALPMPIVISNPVREIRAMLAGLLRQTVADQVWSVQHPAPPVHDFDDDGILDDVDPMPYVPQ